ncbi:DUF4394 domain-containing protein [Maritimibacter sp. DP1N21-5]|uniref:DUF4394 domain-containing protein n=1 Tax=Maritimibacter sp. DP1N21-5 TaxID=2836867 RepID=UPI001C486F83|nr:DUF4394 domain-containing protein [Maritimibacter sp. DP1N21-5]MBV7410461.1 DUF4394 domain-containing protein [Maritimibacter sp. DP1N21-5]
MKTLTTAATLALTTALAAPALADAHANTMGYALADDGMTLVTMASIAEPAAVQTYELSEKLHAIAYRPVTGELLGFGDGKIVSVNAMTGEITDLGATFGDNAMTGGDYVAFDFNNAIDAVRAVGSDGANLVYFPEGFGDGDERAGSVMRFTDAAYGAGDANEGTTPMIFANAYTNAIPGAKASETAQFALDAETNALVTLANNDGTLGTVGPIMVDGAEADISAWGGMDIMSASEGENAAYAILQMEGADTAGLYMIDLETAEATMLADLGMGGFTGFAASPSM